MTGVDLVICEQQNLAIVESGDGGGVFNEDGTVDMVLIRPCNGRGPYSNIYEADVLAREAEKFSGLAMYNDHESPEAQRARQGLPRSVSDLAGVVKQAWWDPAYTTAKDAAKGFGRGAVVGRCRLTDAMETLVRKIPEAVKGSLNTQATNKRQGVRNGRRGWIVEGFVNDPERSSFDLVTRAGAGGRVAAVLEAAAGGHGDDEQVEGGGRVGLTLRDALASDEVRDWMRGEIARGVHETLGGRDADSAGLVLESSAVPVAWEAAVRRRGLDPGVFSGTGHRAVSGVAETPAPRKMVPDQASNRVIEAAVAVIPPQERGPREALLIQGKLSRATIDALYPERAA